MTILLAVLVAALAAAFVAQGAVFGRAQAKSTEAHTAERANLLAALLARTPAEYAGLIVAGRPRPTRDSPATPEGEPKPPTKPIGL